MRLPGFTHLVFSAALVFAPALQASSPNSLKTSQRAPVVTSLGSTSLAQAQQRAASARFSSTGSPRKTLRPLPDPRISHSARSSSIQTTNSGQAIEFPVTEANSSERGFSGLSSRDSNNANGGGTNGISEPPDQGFATNGSQVFEAVNLAFRIFSPNGTPLSAPIDFNGFFAVLPQSGANSFNDLSDPRVFFDPQSKRFFLTILEFQTDATTGAFLGSEVLLAVSQTSDATGNYYLYSINVSNKVDPICKPGCLGDQPLIGVNDDGFYISTNEFTNSQATPFAGALITALDKDALIHNTKIYGTAYLLPNDFSVEPALPAPGAVTTQHHGTEYFTESLDFGPPSNGNSLRLFALTNTESIEGPSPTTILSASDVATESYAFPADPAVQKAGSYPLGQSLGDPEEYLDTNDDRMLQLYYANGKLYTALETELQDPDDAFPRTGAAWFVIDPEGTSTTVTGHILSQGYVGIKNGSVLFPAFAVNNSGEGIIGFSFSGTNYYPSAGYVKYSNGSVEQKVHVAGAGQNPEDGFSGYPQFGGSGVARWGDYSAAGVSPGGSLWFAAEYVPNDIRHPRTTYTNWGTFVSRVQ